MKKLIVFAAALAAGVATFGAHAEDIAVAAEKQADLKSAVSKTVEEKNAAADDGKGEEKKEAALAAVEDGAGKAKSPASKKIAAAKSHGGRYGTIIEKYASTYGVPVSLARAVIQVESNYKADARGKAGEIGLMQIKPATARMMGYSGSNEGLYHPETNIKFGMKYLGKAHELGGGTVCGTILKYNAGHAAKRMNPVSSAYCSKVKQHLAAL